MATQDTKSAGKVLKVLDVLLRNFAYGFSNSDLIESTGYSASDITRYTQTLINSGFAERIPETGRVRASHQLARAAIQILNSLESAELRLSECKKRILG